tara:strand:+ start:329 stop:1060 length:732 start_codon:yes stop_codon:yes gene_type:complete
VKGRRYKVCVFSYSFKHKKTNDIINLLSKENCVDIVLAAPKQNLKLKLDWKPLMKKKQSMRLYETKKLCLKKKIKYFELKHKNFIKIKSIVKKYKINLGIISGARILDKKTIKLFKYGIINLHPGKIPETSGLDSFFWTIKKNIYPSATAHFIDQYTDRGKIIINKRIKVFLGDDFYSVTKRIYKCQIHILKKISAIINNNKIFLTKPVLNYKKNDQMDINEKKNIYYKEFNNWKKNIINEFL